MACLKSSAAATFPTTSHDQHEHGGTGTLATFIGGVGVFYATTVGLMVMLAALIGPLVPSTLLPFVQPAFELLAAIFVADASSGAAHFLLDHMDTGDALRGRSPSSLAGVHAVLDSDAFSSSNAWHRFVWEQQQHHPFPFPKQHESHEPTSLSVRRPGTEQGGQILFDVIAVAVSALTLGTFALGALPVDAWVLRVMLGSYALAWAAFRWTHFWSHQRNWSPETLNWAVSWAQDVGLLLHPRTHRLHHQTYDGHFCLLNGWAGEYTQLWYRTFLAAGIV